MLKCEKSALKFVGTINGYSTGSPPQKQLLKHKLLKGLVLIVLIRATFLVLIPSTPDCELCNTISLFLGDNTSCFPKRNLLAIMLLLAVICLSMMFTDCHRPFEKSTVSFFHIFTIIMSTSSISNHLLDINLHSSQFQLRLLLKSMALFQTTCYMLSSGYVIFFFNGSFKCLPGQYLSLQTFCQIFWVVMNSIATTTSIFSSIWFYFHALIYFLYILLRLKELILIEDSTQTNIASSRVYRINWIAKCNAIFNNIESGNREIRSMALTTFSSLALFINFTLFVCFIVGVDDPMVRWPILIPVTLSLIGIIIFVRILVVDANNKIDRLTLIIYRLARNSTKLTVKIKSLTTIDRLTTKPIGFYIGETFRIESLVLLKIIFENITIFLLLIDAFKKQT
ncbi:uncharacterized protein LOC107368465 [Tetranychus urticae]|nr:uncharacterized protein LOC107368465 [Tetranychus urticae]